MIRADKITDEIQRLIDNFLVNEAPLLVKKNL